MSLHVISRLYVGRKRIPVFGVSAFIIGVLLGALLLNLGGVPGVNVPPYKPPPYTPPHTPPSYFTLTLSGDYIGRGVFSTSLPEMTIQVNASQYSLPVNLSEVSGYSELKNWLGINSEQEDFLSENGFVVLRVNEFDNLADFYDYALALGMPIVITTDAVLHTYHVLFDETLKRIEMSELIDVINATIKTLLEKAQYEAENFAGTPLECASQLDLMYLEVAYALIQPSFSPTTGEANAEMTLISSHSDILPSPIFGYEEDYTQYIPRGHYTQNQRLEAYFRTMMWLGRMRFALLKDNSVDVNQTRAAVLLTWIVRGDENVYSAWQRIYEVTKFFVGVSDDLTFEDYLAVLNDYEIYLPEQLRDEHVVISLAQSLLERNKAKILGTYAETYPWLPQECELERILNETAGLRFMGQRFIPDSYIFQQLVYPQVGNWMDPRLLPKGLDVPAVLGSDLAKKILEETEAKYENYTVQLEKLRAEFKTLSVTNWTRNLYWGWLYTANTTLEDIPPEAKYPTFMTTSAWGYEKLQTFEGTWTELRHDTILYAKQSYTPYIIGIPPSNTAYVEPYPETYRRLIGLINMTINGLTQLELLPSDVNTSLTSFIDVSKLFLNASIIELEGKTLDQNMQEQIRQAARTLIGILRVASDEVQSVTIVADVHTDPNYPPKVLEEALGKLNVLVVIYADGDGNLYAGAGPVYNYFEFIQPLNKRLTDEEWREMLETSPPDPPEWTDNFTR